MTDDELDRCGPPDLVFTVAGMRGAQFQVRPISREPKPDTVGFLYGKVGDKLLQCGAAQFRNGKWVRLSKSKAPEPTHWAVMVSE